MSNREVPEIGPMVKVARKKRGLTLEQLAEKSGVSRSMLSTIERGEVNPTFSVVWSLTQTLGISLNQLDEGGSSNPVIEHTHAYSIPSQSSPDGLATLSMLSPRTTILPVEWYLLKMQPGAVLESEPHSRGTYEHLTSLSGTLQVDVATRKIELAPGDTARYSGDVKHAIRNTSDQPAEAILLIAQPSQYDYRPLSA